MSLTADHAPPAGRSPSVRLLPPAFRRLPSAAQSVWFVCAFLGAAAAVYLAGWGWDAAGQSALLALAVHAVLLPLAFALALRVVPGPLRWAGALCLLLSLLCAAAVWWPAVPLSLRAWLIRAHVLFGIAVGVSLAASWLREHTTRSRGRRAFLAAAVAALLLLPAGAYLAAAAGRSSWQPPRYDAAAVCDFLTATTQVQSGEAAFPSAIRLGRGEEGGCQRGGCHANVHAQSTAHTRAGSTPGYRAALADFDRRRGPEAGRWCRGCHDPESLRPGSTSARAGITCVTCHAVRTVHALYGSASLDQGTTGSAGGTFALNAQRSTLNAPRSALNASALEPRLRPIAHRQRYLTRDLHESAEFCAACHRKSFSLPQNAFRWMPGPDEYGQWQASRFSGSALFAPGPASAPRTCIDCHDAHGRDEGRGTGPRGTGSDESEPLHPSALIPRPSPFAPRLSSLSLDVFLVRPAAGGRPAEPQPIDEAPGPKPGSRVYLDVVVRNTGIGHDFPTGMPDLQESWLDVRVESASGGRGARGEGRGSSGNPQSRLDPRAHAYRLVALDRQGEVIRHGDLDRMVAAAEWRTIPAGQADLARYALTVPPGGLGTVTIRLLRRLRPDFCRWAGLKQDPPRVLAEVRAVPGAQPAPRDHRHVRDVRNARSASSFILHPSSFGPARWRHYGTALARMGANPAALQALNRSLALAPHDAETRLALGRVFFEEGDLLAAQEQFQAALIDPRSRDRAAAWQAALRRQMGQPAAAAALLEPLARAYPRDRRVRFELGMAYRELLRLEDAAGQFEALLSVDPTDVSGHYNLMRCWQGLNRLPEARREETVYRLLADDDTPAPRPRGDLSLSQESRPLHVHPLEAGK